jgi:3-hydroxybutyryl-CoA dehydrogenase
MSVGNVGIVGLGTMGLGLAEMFTSQGFEVRGFDPRAGVITPDSHSWALRDNFTFSSSVAECVSGVDLVIEAVAENLEVKKSVLTEISTLTRGIVASNTSTFMPSVLARWVTHPERFVVAHFFNPPHLVPLVEIVPGPETGESVTAQIVSLLTRLGRHPVLLEAEYPGFVANRLQAALLREALAIIDAGIASPSAIDDIVATGLAPRWAAAGPIGVVDLGGLDIFEKVCAELFPVLSNATKPSSNLTSRVRSGDLGAKTGRGFYVHDMATDAATFEAMKRHFELDDRPTSPDA